MIEDIDHYARGKLDPDYTPPPPPGGRFPGFAWPYDEADLLELWLQWEEHGVMPEPGGYFDQPPEWRDAITWCRRIYNARAYQIEKEVKARTPPT